MIQKRVSELRPGDRIVFTVTSVSEPYTPHGGGKTLIAVGLQNTHTLSITMRPVEHVVVLGLGTAGGIDGVAGVESAAKREAILKTLVKEEI